MKQDVKNFWMGVIIGFIVTILFAFVTVNILKFFPIFGPFVGGLVAGLIARKDVMNAGKAGLAAGALGAIFASIDFLLNTGFLKGTTLIFAEITGFLFLFSMIAYFVIIGFIGGAIGGVLRH
jgi:uncharacterized protein YqgC (DUF456 family)